MTIAMDDSGITDIAGIRRFLKGSCGVKLQGIAQEEQYRWIDEVLERFTYFELRKKDKNAVKKYLMRMTGFSDAQITRLINRKLNYGNVDLLRGVRHCFARTYTKADIEFVLVNQPRCGKSHTILFRESRIIAANLVANRRFKANRGLLLAG